MAQLLNYVTMDLTASVMLHPVWKQLWKAAGNKAHIPRKHLPEAGEDHHPGGDEEATGCRRDLPRDARVWFVPALTASLRIQKGLTQNMPGSLS